MDKYELLKYLVNNDTAHDTTEIKDPYGSLLEIGKSYLIRAITMIYTGKVKAITKDEVLLTNACWIADTGRFADCLKSCIFDEVEPYLNDVAINKATFLDYTEIATLPSEQK